MCITACQCMFAFCKYAFCACGWGLQLRGEDWLVCVNHLRFQIHHIHRLMNQSFSIQIDCDCALVFIHTDVYKNSCLY